MTDYGFLVVVFSFLLDFRYCNVSYVWSSWISISTSTLKHFVLFFHSSIAKKIPHSMAAFCIMKDFLCAHKYKYERDWNCSTVNIEEQPTFSTLDDFTWYNIVWLRFESENKQHDRNDYLVNWFWYFEQHQTTVKIEQISNYEWITITSQPKFINVYHRRRRNSLAINAN